MRHKKNIALNLQNITPHFKGKIKIITLILVIIMLSFVNITLSLSDAFYNSNVSALSYSSNVGVGFTFNPTLSISLSSSDLVINDLVPGSTLDSNNISISISTNSAYGYILSANVANEDLIKSSNNNSSITNNVNNNTYRFSSIANNVSLESLTTDNTWGYSTKMSSESLWSSYSGLSNNENKTLLDTNSNSAVDNIGANDIDSIDFKIGARAGSTQASGAYTGVINFYATTKPTPMNLAESYFSHGKSRYKGYYAMQDMTTEICNDTEVIGEESQTKLIDKRDDKVYWATKLADGHCWMTQNLDLDLSHNVPLTSETTDLNDTTSVIYQDGYTLVNDTIKWVPSTDANTINFEGISVRGWVNSQNKPSSASKIDDINTGHSSLGNWYNWAAVVASNNSDYLGNGDVANSICPKNWRLPSNSDNEFVVLNNFYNSGSTSSDTNLLIAPLWFIRSGNIDKGNLNFFFDNGFYWTKTTYATPNSVGNLRFSSTKVEPKYAGNTYGRNSGFSARCLAR